MCIQASRVQPASRKYLLRKEWCGIDKKLCSTAQPKYPHQKLKLVNHFISHFLTNSITGILSRPTNLFVGLNMKIKINILQILIN